MGDTRVDLELREIKNTRTTAMAIQVDLGSSTVARGVERKDPKFLLMGQNRTQS